MKRLIKYLWPVFALSILVIFSETAIDGAKNGLYLWANVIVPTLLPFIILTNIMLHGQTLSYLVNEPLFKKFQPSILLSILVGFLCGYPMGGKFVHDLFVSGYIDYRLANILLTHCNNASPMFILGYVIYYGLPNLSSIVGILLAIYIPNILIFIFRYLAYQKKQDKSVRLELPNHEIPLKELFKESILTTCIIGIYIMIFSIITSLLAPYAKGVLFYPISALEITVGISIIKESLFSDIKKTVLIVILTSFGGFSAVAQTKSVANHKALSFLSYIFWKLIIACLSGAITYLLYSCNLLV